MPQQPRKPKVPRGRASSWTVTELEILSDGTAPEAQSSAQQAWRRQAPRAFRSLLDADALERRGDDPTATFPDAT